MRYEPGQVVDKKYDVLEPLGQGGMSEVYKARDRETGQIVVVKIPYAHLIGDPGTFSRYQREIEIGSRLNHPNIQHLVNAGRLGSGISPYMALEYIEGRSFRGYIDEHRPLPIEEAERLILQIVDAVEYCHQRGVIHRDLKPENLLITDEGQLKLVDFGIALLSGARRLTFGALSNSLGTPDYMAPEQVRGERGDVRTDVYATGVMLYEMLAGEVPYQGDNALAVMAQRVRTDPPPIHHVRPDVPKSLEIVALRALRRDPAERYQSMDEMRFDLEHLDQARMPNFVLERFPLGRAGPMPSSRRTAIVTFVVFATLLALGIIAEMVHRVQVTH